MRKLKTSISWVVAAFVILVGLALAQTATTGDIGILEKIYNVLVSIDSKIQAPIQPIPSTPPTTPPNTTPPTTPPVVTTPPVTTPPTPVNPPVTTPPITPTSSPLKQLTGHPRFFASQTELASLTAIAATPEGKALVAGCTTGLKSTSTAVTAVWDRCICGCILYRLNGDQTAAASAVADFMSLQSVKPTSPNEMCGLPAFAWDTLYPVLSSTQRSTVVTTVQAAMDSRGTDSYGLWSYNGYNNKAGDGMGLALATSGDLASGTKDYVLDFWQNNWNVLHPVAPLTHTYASIQIDMPDCGNNEGWGYYSNNCQSNWLTRGLWTSAMQGDPNLGYLNIGFFDRYPLWFLWQHEPNLKPTGSSVAPGFPWAISTKNYECGWTSARQAFDMLRAATSGPNGPTARWILNQLGGYSAGISTPGISALYGLFLGDPRVAGVDPGTQALPLSFQKNLGDLFFRSDWTTAATVLYFGNNRYAMRSVSSNGISLFKRVPLLMYRGQVINHTYESGDFGNVVAFYKDTQPAVVSQTASTIDMPGISTGTLTHNSDGSWTGDALKNLTVSKLTPGASVAQVTRDLRTVSMTADLSTITVQDDVACDSTLTPHVCWNMPTNPTVSLDSTGLCTGLTITGTDNTTTCTLTFDRPLPYKVVGGPNNFADAYDGTPPAAGVANSDMPHWSVADQLHFGGFYRAHVLLPTGGGRLTTTIKVSP